MTKIISLGARLAAARQAAGLSLEETAKKIKLSEEFLLAIETDFKKENLHSIAACDPGYRRLLVFRYANMLGIPLSEIRSQLPPMASLSPSESSFLKNWNQQPVLPSVSCWAVRSSSFYFPSTRTASLWRIALLLLVLFFFFQGWNILRHLHFIIRTFSLS